MPPYGDSTASMPHLSGLAKEGTVFDNMFTEQLRAAGIRCLNNAKEDCNLKPTPLAWDESSPSRIGHTSGHRSFVLSQ